MNCMEARDAMVVAELSELRANAAPTALSDHLNACAPCRSRATAIVSSTSRMGALLDARQHRPTRATLSRRLALIAAFPIAASVLAVVAIKAINAINTKQPHIGTPAASASPLPVARHVSLTVAPGQRATLLKTADPTVTVIWLTPGEGQ